jgi:hypothetical protein
VANQRIVAVAKEPIRALRLGQKKSRREQVPLIFVEEKIWELCDGERFTKTEMRGLVPKGDAVLSATYA